MSSKKPAKPKAKTPMSFRIEHPEKITELREWFGAKFKRIFGHAHPEGVPTASLIVNHAIHSLHAIETDPDVCVSSISGSIRNMNETLLLAMEREVGRLLTGLEIRYEVKRAADGGLDWVVYMKQEQEEPTHALRVGPEMLRRGYEHGEDQDLLVRPDRDFTVC